MSRCEPLAWTMCSPCVDFCREIGVHLHRHTPNFCKIHRGNSSSLTQRVVYRSRLCLTGVQSWG